MENYNDSLLQEIEKLKTSANSIGKISEIFQTLRTIGKKHLEINDAFKENINHLNEYNEEFSDLNNSIRTNIIELKETALKFPEQLIDIEDKNKKNLEKTENKLIKELEVQNLQIVKTISHKLEEITNTLSNVKIWLIIISIINILILGIITYKFFFV
ncbi:hypothetical protein J6A34_01795 [bacterium]|nr:hypothetical protein [bacterium]